MVMFVFVFSRTVFDFAGVLVTAAVARVGCCGLTIGGWFR